MRVAKRAHAADVAGHANLDVAVGADELVAASDRVEVLEIIEANGALRLAIHANLCSQRQAGC